PVEGRSVSRRLARRPHQRAGLPKARPLARRNASLTSDQRTRASPASALRSRNSSLGTGGASRPYGDPGLLPGDVLEAVPGVAAERRPDYDLQLCRLAAVVERRVDDALVEVDGVAGAERRRALLDVLRDAAGPDDDHLLLARVAVEVVAAARLE